MGFPNTFRNSEFVLSISNFPGISDHDSFKYFDNYIRGVEIPDLTLDTVESVLLDYTINHPISQRNNSYSELTVNFKLSENLMNYFFATRYIQNVRNGINESKDLTDQMAGNLIHKISVSVKDNQKRTIANIDYINSIVTNLSGLSLTYGEDTEIEFGITFKYENIIVNINGKE